MIYTERTVTVKSGKSSIDEPVILFRGDRGLEVRFLINETKLKYYSSTNLIEKIHATYGQLVIDKPDGSDIFSNITETKDGAIVFTITEDMIDEIPEVGFYTFQIRLYDDEKVSRVSIPPIEQGIEVREPIALEGEETGTEAIVDEGAVGYALVRETEEVVDTFDENGNYNKTVWATGDVISEAKLNKIEDALDILNQNDKSLNSKFDTSTTIERKDLSEVYPIVKSFQYPDGNAYTDTRGRSMFNIPLSDYIGFYITATCLYSSAIMVIFDASGKVLGHKGDAKENPDVGETWVDEHIVVSDLLEEYPTAHHISLSSFSLSSANTSLSVYADVEVESEGASNGVALPLNGKKWVVIGDSLTESNSRTSKNYHDYAADETGCTVINMGLSGSGYKKKDDTNNAFYQRVLNIPTDADIITIFGSGNDLSSGVDLGSVTDTGTDTLCGCMHKTIQNLFSVMPGARLGIVLPTPWIGHQPNNKDDAMAKYCEALKEIAGHYSIPVLDLYHGSNLRPWDATFRSLYYKKDDGNGVHPDEDGHALIANKFKMFIQSL